MDQNQRQPRKLTNDGRDVEFSKELADQDDRIAMERAKAADERAKKRK